jgi:tRNA G46 methylase TrmB
MMTRHPALSWAARSKKDWTGPPPDWIETRYEKKAKKQGERPVYLLFSRRPRGAETTPEAGPGMTENH